MVGLDEEGHRRDNLLRSFPVEVEGPAGAAFRAEAVHKDLVRSPSAAAECWCIRRPDVEVMAMIQAVVVVHPALAAAAAHQASACRLALAVACPSCVLEEEVRGEAVPGPEVDRQATVPVEEASAAHQRFEIRVKWHRAVDRDVEVVVVVVLPSTVLVEVARSRREEAEEEDLEEDPYAAAVARSPLQAVLVVLVVLQDADGAFADVVVVDEEGEAVVVRERPSADLAAVVAAGPS